MSSGTNESGHFHAVRFYDNRESLCRIAADFLGRGLADDQPALVVARPDHCAGIVDAMRAQHVDVDRMQDSGDLLLLDAGDVLSTFMRDGAPHDELFQESMSAAIDGVARGRKGLTVRAYGEMVDLLWRDGLTIAAIRLEMLWNWLAMTHEFSLLCGYAMRNFYKDAHVSEIYRQHTHVVNADGVAALAAERLWPGNHEEEAKKN